MPNLRLSAIALLPILLCSLPLKAQPQKPVEPATLFQRYGIRTLASPVPASEFSLPDLQNTYQSLKDYRGQWILLNFWATWCGACASQIGELNALHQSMGEKGVKILAVAIEGSPAELERYRQQPHHPLGS